MRLFILTILFAAAVLLPAPALHAQQQPPAPPARPAPLPAPPDKDRDFDVDVDIDVDPEDGGPAEKVVATAPTVIVSFCGGSSSISVRGWDRNEVRVRANSGESIDLRSFKEGNGSGAVSRVEVSLASDIRIRRRLGVCQSTGDLQLDVPRGAVLDLRTSEGDMDIENVARLHAESLHGSFSFRGITKAIEATSYNGDIRIERTRGTIALNSISGSIEVRDAAPLDPGDGLAVSSVSGEVSFSNCSYGRAQVNSVTGDLIWNGPLANGGSYVFASTNGDITFVLPANSSFRVTAKVAAQGLVDTHFPLRSEGDTSFKALGQQVTGTYGGGSARLTLTTFNGSIRLRKRSP